MIVYSGGQNGVDQAGLRSAKKAGFRTGGFIPRGFKTLDGPRPDLGCDFGLEEYNSFAYSPCTRANVHISDATLRYVRNYLTVGERRTWKAICAELKPSFDIIPGMTSSWTVVMWLREMFDVVAGTGILNIAGNSECSVPGIGAEAEKFFDKVFVLLKSRK